MPNPITRRVEVHTKVVSEADQLATLPQHNYVPGGTDLCMTCGQIQLHPIHGIDADALPDDVKQVQPLVGDPSYQKAAYTGKGSMVALFCDDKAVAGLDIQGGSDFPVEETSEMHVTLAFLPETPEGQELLDLRELVAAMAAVQGPLTGTWGGTARFNPSEGSDDKPVLVALPDLPDLSSFREFVVTCLDSAGFPVAKNHGYTPHVTVAYDDQGRVRAEGPLEFDALTLATPMGNFTFDLSGKGAGGPVEWASVLERVAGAGSTPAEAAAVVEIELDAEQAKLPDADQQSFDAESERIKESAESETAKGVHAFKAAQWTHPNGHPRCRICGQEESISPECNRAPTAAEQQKFQDKLEAEFGDKPEVALLSVSDRVPAPAEPLPATKAFLTEVNGKTLLTAPASVFVPTWEKALTPNQHFLWLQGRFVGAEKANRNGAFWTTADLEMGAPTVNHGPVNWLHEAHHVIGTIADSKLVLPSETAGEGFNEPHIVAAAAIWRWIFPDESFVLEEASDQGKLWYSMECVSREVSCEGPNGCGAVVPYMDMITAKASVCSHVRERSSTRRFIDPTFLGAAVILPPVRPGWADADARVMREAAALAETAYDQAGQPDVTSIEWEALMGSVISFART